LTTKLDNTAIKQLYNSYLEGISDISRVNCPSPETLLKSIRQNQSTMRNRRLIRHLTRCIHCSKEFEFIANIVREESNLNCQLGSTINTRELEPRALKPNRFRFSSFHLKYVFIFASISIVFFAGVKIFKSQSHYLYRRARASPLHLIYPDNSSLTKSKLYFNWYDSLETGHYVIQIFDDTLLPIWNSQKIKDKVYIPSASLLSKLNTNTRYFWMVTAYDISGKRIKSRLNDFTIKK